MELQKKHSRTTHGLSKMPGYTVWSSIKARCVNKNDKAYKDYGGRGIQLCERWMNFLSFIEDMGPRPSNRHSIERIDNNGNYELSNCKWALPGEQACNKRNNVLVEYEGELKPLRIVCKELGITDHRVVRARIVRYGWSLQKALQTPKLPPKRKPSSLKEGVRVASGWQDKAASLRRITFIVRLKIKQYGNVR